MSRRETSLQQINREILQEKAEALGRAGERLERLLRALEVARSELRQMQGSASLEAIAQAERRYAALRAQAMKARWHLLIQREAIGFRRHSVVAELFPVPPSQGQSARDGREG